MTNTLPPAYQLIIKQLLPKGSLKILDLGCGIGAAAKTLNKSKNHQFFGVDRYESYLKICRRSGLYEEVIKADLKKVKFEKKSFDVVILFQVIEHLNKGDAKKLINKAISFASRAVVITVPNGSCNQEAYDGNIYNKHLSIWNVADLKKMGFKVYGQGLKVIYGTQSYEGRIEANWWQKIIVPIAIFLLPIIMVYPRIAAQLIAIKYLDESYR